MPRLLAVPRLSAAATAVGAGLFIALAFGVSAHPSAGSFDNRVLHDVIDQRSGALTGLAKFFTTLGTGFVVYPVLAVAGLVLARRSGAWQVSAAAIGWLAIGQGLRLAINDAIARPRPPQPLHLVRAAGHAFPSGHTTTATIGYGLTALLLLRVAARSPGIRSLVLLIVFVIIGCVGLSRVYLGVHWPTDVLGGWTFGEAWVSFGAALAVLAERRRRRSG